MAHPQPTELRARVSGASVDEKDSTQNGHKKQHTFADDVPLLDEEAILSKHEIMEQQAIEIELEKTSLTSSRKERLRFRDGERLIDYILVYETPAEDTKLDEDDQEKEDENAERRSVFEANLKEAGLELEYEEGVSTKVRLPVYNMSHFYCL